MEDEGQEGEAVSAMLAREIPPGDVVIVVTPIAGGWPKGSLMGKTR
jgi:hypothetical protein